MRGRGDGAGVVRAAGVPPGHAGDELKRRIYLFATLITLPYLPIVAAVRADEEPHALLLYPALTLLLAAVTVGLWTRRLPVSIAERAVLVGVPALVVGRLAAAAVAGSADEVRQLATETAGPTLVALVLLAYLAFERATARRWALTMWAAFTLALLPAGPTAEASPGLAIALVRQSLTVLMVLLLAGFLAAVKEQLAGERARAETLETLVRTDPLTGALNRRGAVEALRTQLSRTTRYGGTLAVALVDVDRFKARNDRHGHAAGDHALRAIVAVLVGQVRSSDVVARWGGDELLVIAPATSDDAAAASAERWRRQVAALALDAGGRPLSLSIGVASAGPGDDVDGLLGRADRALYRAKTAGGDQVAVAGADEGVLARRDDAGGAAVGGPGHGRAVADASRGPATIPPVTPPGGTCAGGIDLTDATSPATAPPGAEGDPQRASGAR